MLPKFFSCSAYSDRASTALAASGLKESSNRIGRCRHYRLVRPVLSPRRTPTPPRSGRQPRGWRHEGPRERGRRSLASRGHEKMRGRHGKVAFLVMPETTWPRTPEKVASSTSTRRTAEVRPARGRRRLCFALHFILCDFSSHQILQ